MSVQVAHGWPCGTQWVVTMPNPLILFGAFDRHNFGDLLLAHVAAALLPGRELHFAGLAERDLRGWGGHRVHALPDLLAELAPRRPDLLHVGGEILDCSAWQAAVMLLPPQQAQAVIAYLEPRAQERADWVARMTGGAQAPYVISRARWPGLRRVVFSGVGGVGLRSAASALRAEVIAALHAAAFVSVRDPVTRAALVEAGIAARLQPDPALLVADLFGARIASQTQSGEVAALHAVFAHGWIALQLGPEFSADVCLDALASGLRAVLEATGLGLALFRAGLAPWHDDLGLLHRLAARLPARAVRIVEAAGLWDIGAVIAASRAFVGSSLHGRIVATAFGLPRLSLVPTDRGGQAAKLAACLDGWELPGLPTCATPDALAPALSRALSADASALQRQAASLSERCQLAWNGLLESLA